MIETIRQWFEVIVVVALALVVWFSRTAVFGKPKLGNYRMSDFDNDEQEEKSERKIANLK